MNQNMKKKVMVNTEHLLLFLQLWTVFFSFSYLNVPLRDPTFMQGFSLDMIKLSSAQLVLSQKSQLFVWWTLFQKMSWEFFLHRPMERNDILPPPLMARHTWGSWFKQTWIFTTQGCFLASLGFTDRVVFEKKKLYNFLNIFLCTPPPLLWPHSTLDNVI